MSEERKKERKRRSVCGTETWPRLWVGREDKHSVPSLPALFYSHKLLGAAVSPFNLGQTDGDSVCGDCINISNPDEGCSFGATSCFRKEGQGRWRQRTTDKSSELTDFSHYRVPSFLRSPLSPPVFSFLFYSPSLSLSLCSLKTAAGWWKAGMWWRTPAA